MWPGDGLSLRISSCVGKAFGQGAAAPCVRDTRGLAIRTISGLLTARPQHVINRRKRPVSDALSEIRYQVALANRMLANEGVLDAFGHVSLRHSTDSGRYLLSRSRSPGL